MNSQLILLASSSFFLSSCTLKWMGSAFEVNVIPEISSVRQLQIYEIYRKFGDAAISNCKLNSPISENLNYHNLIVQYLARRYLLKIPSGTDISLPEFITLSIYFDGDYRGRKSAFENGSECQPIIDFPLIAEQALNRLPKEKGTFFSFDRIPLTELRSRYAKGKTLDKRDFISTTRKHPSNFEFTSWDKKYVEVVLKITGEGGRDIAPFPQFASEQEVLMGPESKYIVEDVDDDAVASQRKYHLVTLKRVDTGIQLPPNKDLVVPFTKAEKIDLETVVPGYSEFFVDRLKDLKTTAKDNFKQVKTKNRFSISWNEGQFVFECERKPKVQCTIKATSYDFDDFVVFLSPLIPGPILFPFDKDFELLDIDEVLNNRLRAHVGPHLVLANRISCGTSSLKTTENKNLSHYMFCVLSKKKNIGFILPESAVSEEE